MSKGYYGLFSSCIFGMTQRNKVAKFCIPQGARNCTENWNHTIFVAVACSEEKIYYMYEKFLECTDYVGWNKKIPVIVFMFLFSLNLHHS